MSGLEKKSGRPLSQNTEALDRLITTLRSGGSNVAGLLLLLIVLSGLFSVLMPRMFPTITTLQAMALQIPVLGLLSIAMAVPLISGGLNLAIIATANGSGLLMAWILTGLMPPHAGGATLVIWLSAALVAGLAACILVGIVTGLLVADIGVHPILVTLGTMTLIHGLSIFLTRGRTLSGFPDFLIAISNNSWMGVPISFFIFAVVAVIVHALLTRSKLGIRIHMIGSNLEATRYSGVSTRRVLVWVYVISSVLCWLAAVLMMGQLNSAGADFSQSFLLITILAAILGGVNPYGGFGRILGLFIALWILQVIASGFNLLNISPHLALASWGLILIFVMAVKRVAAIHSLTLIGRRSQKDIQTKPISGERPEDQQ